MSASGEHPQGLGLGWGSHPNAVHTGKEDRPWGWGRHARRASILDFRFDVFDVCLETNKNICSLFH